MPKQYIIQSVGGQKVAQPISGSDVIDNLPSTITNKALSANQGRVLNEKIESATDTIEGVSGGDEWLSTQAYSTNDYAIYQNKLYQCKANTTAGILPTNTTYWENLSVKTLNNNLGGLVFSSVDGVPYVKVGADSPRPFSGDCEASIPSVGQVGFEYGFPKTDSRTILALPYNHQKYLKVSLHPYLTTFGTVEITLGSTTIYTFPDLGTSATIYTQTIDMTPYISQEGNVGIVWTNIRLSSGDFNNTKLALTNTH